MAVFAGDKPVVSTMTAMKVTLDKETGKEILEAFDETHKAYPEDIIAYILTYENTGEKSIKNLKPVGPVPENTEYVGNSEKSSVEAEVEFSIDTGETYHKPPVMYTKIDENGKEIEAEATPDMYTHVRWTVPVLKAGDKVIFEYRVKVK